MIKEERNFERRVRYEGPPDEIGQLAITFNAMLAALQAAYQQVAEALEAQRWFVADASHELRTPLTTLRGNLALLRRDPPISDEDRHAVLTDIVDENERMIRLVNDLLTLARTDSVPHLETTSVPLQPLLVEVERQITALHPSEHFVLDCPTGVTVSGHRDALKQVLLILLDNAFKFTATEGKVRLSAKSQGNQVSIQVEDTGIGIETTELPRIFRRFYRGDFARNGSGYGLGLPIAKALIEKQQGRISVESIVNSGSIFTVWLQKA